MELVDRARPAQELAVLVSPTALASVFRPRHVCTNKGFPRLAARIGTFARQKVLEGGGKAAMLRPAAADALMFGIVGAKENLIPHQALRTVTPRGLK